MTGKLILAVMTLYLLSALRQILADPTGQWIFLFAPVKKGKGKERGKKTCRHGFGSHPSPLYLSEAGRNNNNHFS